MDQTLALALVMAAVAASAITMALVHIRAQRRLDWLRRRIGAI